jgi:outer membrane protein assembly factor BamD (BamD/ComL family)
MATTPKKRLILVVGAAIAMMATGAFAQSSAPPADRILYDRGIESIEHGNYAAARLTLNTLVNTYATSEYQAKAKLAIAVSWLRQGDEYALAQAEAEYKDFIRFYPKMKEAAEQQVGEPLRKIREQKAAEVEHKDFILFYPNMKEAAELQVGEPLRKILEQKAAETEHKDFILFYPNMKEAAEPQVGEPPRKSREQKKVVPR